MRDSVDGYLLDYGLMTVAQLITMGSYPARQGRQQVAK